MFGWAMQDILYVYVFNGLFPFLSFPIFYPRDYTRLEPCPCTFCRPLRCCYAQSGKNLPSIASHCNASQSLQTRPNQTKPNFVHPATPTSSLLLPIPIITHILESSRKRSFTPSFVFVSLLCPHLINHIHPPSFGLPTSKPDSIALDVHVPSWSTNRINHPRVVSQVQPAADFTLPIVEVLQSSRLL